MHGAWDDTIIYQPIMMIAIALTMVFLNSGECKMAVHHVSKTIAMQHDGCTNNNDKTSQYNLHYICLYIYTETNNIYISQLISLRKISIFVLVTVITIVISGGRGGGRTPLSWLKLNWGIILCPTFTNACWRAVACQAWAHVFSTYKYTGLPSLSLFPFGMAINFAWSSGSLVLVLWKKWWHPVQ